MARSDNKILGTGIKSGKGKAYYFGFRPRDDQSASLGYETRTLFELLNSCGAYQGTDKFMGFNDNPTYISRTTDYLATRFPNGSNMIVRHYRTHSETWEGGFSRNLENDEKALALNPLPSDTLILDDLKVNGHQVSYCGKQSMVFKTDSLNRLIAFEGLGSSRIRIDGVNYEFTSNPFITIIFSKENCPETNYFALLEGMGKIRLPISVRPGEKLKITGSDTEKINSRILDGQIELVITPEISGRKIRIEVK